MKTRGVRIPTTSYDALRQQVQAKRGSPTNRREAESPEALPETDAPAAALETAAPVPVVPEARPAPRAPRQAPQARPPRDPGPAGRTPAGKIPAGNTGGRVTLKLNFTAPAVGAYPHYDRVIETMPPRAAVPLLLAKAFEELEAAALRGDDIRRADYVSERNGARISTSRTMDAATLKRLRASLDPHDLMKPSSLGAALATTALSLYLRRRG